MCIRDRCTALTEVQKKVKDHLNLKKRISDLKLTNKKLEKIKRDLKESLKAKENELETERASRLKAVYEERRKNKAKGEKLTQMRKEMDLQNIELESLKRENHEVSMTSESRFYSPGPSRRKVEEDSFLSPDLNTAHTSTKGNVENIHSKVNTGTLVNEGKLHVRNPRRLKSSSPNRMKLVLSSQKLRVGGLGRKGSPRRMIQISSKKTKMYDDTHLHNHGSGKYCEACKYKTWRVQQLKYDPEKLMQNRDMIKHIVCLGCNKTFEVKNFINHCRD